jgi:hypothetical protein
LVTNDSYYGGTDWAKTRCTITTNATETTSPEGVYNASKMVSTDAAESYAQNNLTLATSGVFSFFAKKGDLDYCHSTVWDASANGRRQWFNLATGEVGSTTVFGSGYDKVAAGMEDYGNGWWRCWFAWNNGNTTSAVRTNISSANGAITSPVDSYGYFYGCQAESGVSYKTSYLPTYGTTVTRLADSCSKTGISSLIGQTEGTIFIDMEFNALATNRDIIYLGTSAQAYRLVATIGNAIVAGARVSSSTVTYVGSSALTSGRVKIGYGYKSGDHVLYINGVQIGTSANTSVPTGTISEIQLGTAIINTTISDSINQALLFKTRLSNADLATLSTL